MLFLFILGLLISLIIVIICIFKPEYCKKLAEGLRRHHATRDIEMGRKTGFTDRTVMEMGRSDGADSATEDLLAEYREKFMPKQKSKDADIVDSPTQTAISSATNPPFAYTPISVDKNGEPTKKGEHMCRMILEVFFQRNFVSDRTTILNPLTLHYLELDCYRKDMMLALEFNGRQHYEWVRKYQKTEEDFQKQKWNDEFKTLSCRDLGITLIVVDGRYDYKRIAASLSALLHGRIQGDDIVTVPTGAHRLPDLRKLKAP